MIRSIVLAFDGSRHSWAAWRYGMDLARAYRAGLRVVSVVDARVAHHPKLLEAETLAALNLSEASREKLLLAFEDRRRKQLAEIEQETRAGGVGFTGEVAHGIPAEVVCLEEVHGDLIAMGHRGESPSWQSVMLGSNAEAVIRQCIRPVLLSPAEYAPIDRILACYDSSENSTHALFRAAHLAQSLKLPMTVLTVNRNIQQAEQIVAEARIHLRAATATFEQRTVAGHPADRILDAADAERCGLIVMGVHGHSVVRESIIGSTTEEVMRRTKVPLLLVK